MKKYHSLALEQKENAKHGETFFPIQKYITRLTSVYPFITTHWHEEAELTLVTKGSCIYQIDLGNTSMKQKKVISYLYHHYSYIQSHLAVKNFIQRLMFFI